jgi:hypothetical protein
MKSYNTNKTTIYGVGNPGTAVEQAQKRAGIKIIHTNYIYKYVIETRVFVYKVCKYNKTIITRTASNCWQTDIYSYKKGTNNSIY